MYKDVSVYKHLLYMSKVSWYPVSYVEKNPVDIDRSRTVLETSKVFWYPVSYVEKNPVDIDRSRTVL
jgi:hypothetical protein